MQQEIFRHIAATYMQMKPNNYNTSTVSEHSFSCLVMMLSIECLHDQFIASQLSVDSELCFGSKTSSALSLLLETKDVQLIE